MLQKLEIVQKLIEWLSPTAENLANWFKLKQRMYKELTVKTLVMEIELVAGQTKYTFPDYQRLDETLLVGVRIPTSQYFTESYTGKVIAPIAAHANGFLNLQDNRSNNIKELVPGLDMLKNLQSTVGYFPEKQSEVACYNIKWSKSSWNYASGSAIPTNEDGKVVIIIVDYIDIPEELTIKSNK